MLIWIEPEPKANRRAWSRRFAAKDEATSSTRLSAGDECEITLSREQAEELCRELCQEIFGIKIKRVEA